jgi:hypothetical protein
MSAKIKERPELFFVQQLSKASPKGKAQRVTHGEGFVVVRTPNGRAGHFLDRSIYEAAIRTAMKHK